MHQMKPGPARPPHIWSRPFLAIFALNFVLNMAQFMTNALVPKLAESFGASATIIGLVTGLFAATSLTVRPFVGAATFRFANHVLLAVTALIILSAFICYALATSVEMVVIGRLIHGFGMGFLAPVTLALASNALPESRMASGIGIFSLGQAVAMACGPGIGLVLLGAIGYGPTFFIGAAAMGAVSVLALFLRSTHTPPPATQRFGWSSFIAKEAIAPAVVVFFLGGAYSVVNSFVILYGESVGVTEIGLFFTAYALALLISRPLTGKIADRFGVTAVIVPGTVIYGLAFVLLSTARSLPEFLVAATVSAFGYGICQPAVQALSLMAVDRPRRGIAGNTNYMGLDLSYLVMPAAAGAIVSFAQSHGTSVPGGYSLMFQIMIIPVGLGLLVFLLFARPTRPQRGEIESSPTIEP